MTRETKETKIRFKKPDWAVDQIVRQDSGVVEDICSHGVGHPNEEWLKTVKDKAFGIHGCDGCCCERNRKEKL